MVVIERTPTKFAHRKPTTREPLRVTNAYQLIDADSSETTNEIMRTSCGRFERISDLLIDEPPLTLERCIDHLSDDRVMMGITVQQMAFRASSGEYLVRIP